MVANATPTDDRHAAEEERMVQTLRSKEPEEEITEESRQATMQIRAAILKAEADVRSRHPWLKHQDAVGFGIWAGSLLVMAALTASYHAGVAPWYVPFFGVALATSLLHELEHDLIHRLYFAKGPLAWMSDVMMGGIFVSKCAALDPWTRQKYHLLHHRRSGQMDDIEERLIGLGQPFLFRLAVALFPATAALWLREIKRANASFEHPRGTFFSLQRAVNRIELLFIAAPAIAGALAYLYGSAAAVTALVCWVGPNIWRQFCLIIMSTSCHYYGDITPGNVIVQTQILRHWALTPFQLFCFNFGAEHAIHHIVVAQPFYLRHMVRHAAWEAMARHGVRVNDFGSFFRNNRWLALGGPEDKATAFVAAEKAAKLQKKAQQQPGATVAADGAAASSAKKAM